MKKDTCPGCGAPYNGKYCRNCFYEHFSEETVPSCRKSFPDSGFPEGKGVPKKNSSGGGKKVRKKHPLTRFFLLLWLIYSLMPMLRNWGFRLEAMEAGHRTVAREPVVPEEDLLTLWTEKGIHIFTTRTDAGNLNDSLTLYVENSTDTAVCVVSSVLLVNHEANACGSIWCEAGADAVGKTWLYLEEAELKKAGIQQIQSLSFCLEVSDRDSGTLFVTDLISLEEIPSK